MDYKYIIYKKEGGIAYVTLNRPEVGNAGHIYMGNELRDAWNDAKNDENIRVAILTGAGNRFFCAGADAKAASQGIPVVPWGDIPEDFWKPVILAINGICCGGGWHFVWQSDFAICSENAAFLEPHVSIGWVPLREMMGLATKAPLSVVLRMAFMGTRERMDAKRAYELGIITEVVPSERLMSRATELAEAIIEQSPVAIACIKEVLHRAYELRFAHREVFEYGNLLRAEVAHRSPDYLEGPRAFAEKRRPVWAPYKGRGGGGQPE